MTKTNEPQVRADLEVREFELKSLQFAEYNPRSISDEARGGLRESIQDFGLLELPVVNVRPTPPRIVGGHQRVRELIAEGYTHADCVVVRMDDTAEMAANIALNSPAIQGTFDPVKAVPSLDRIAKRLPKPDHTRMAQLSEKLHEQARRIQAQSNPRAADAEEDEVDEPLSELGKLYQLGEHRLFCGDFRDGGIEALLGNEAVHATITDPPYNLAYTSGKWFRNDKLRAPIENDEMDPEEWREFVTAYCTVFLERTEGTIYSFTSAKEMATVQRIFEEVGGAVLRWIVCEKNAHTLSPGDYHPQYELLLWGAASGANVPIQGDGQPNVLAMQRPTRSALHSAQKPVALIRELVGAATDVGESVLDPFAGSGTVLCVAEELERICYACEIDPQHCDRIRRRWAEQAHGPGADWQSRTPEV